MGKAFVRLEVKQVLPSCTNIPSAGLLYPSLEMGDLEKQTDKSGGKAV
ncbi:hypothetical protein C2W64_00528 [Brevibacillus laterosporus]|nr:hypothetical protein C2W64_00528 [Brevibacillus laterosporus]